MDGEHVIPDAIRELLEKRATFQEWLTRLAELGGEFRPEVADKVRTDYAGRLTEVEGELEGHRSELESALADRTATVEAMASGHDSLSAELEETQLRHAVGEFDDDEWERRRTDHQSKIDEIAARLKEQRAAVDSLETVLSELAGSAGAAAGAIAAEVVDSEPPIPEEIAEAAEPWPDEPETVEPAGGVAADLSADEPPADEEPWMTQPLDDVEAVEVELTEVVLEEVGGSVVEVEASLIDDEPTVVEVESEEVVEAEAEGPGKEEPPEDDLDSSGAEDGSEFMDELEFLESLSLDDTESFDAVSAMLDEEEGESGSGESGRKTEGH